MYICCTALLFSKSLYLLINPLFGLCTDIFGSSHSGSLIVWKVIDFNCSLHLFVFYKRLGSHSSSL